MNESKIPNKKPYPQTLMIIAAIVVILFGGVGIAALMGWLPSSSTQNAKDPVVTPEQQVTETAPVSHNNATESSHYVAGAGSINDVPVKDLPVTSGNSASEDTVPAAVTPADDNRTTAPVREKARERKHTAAAVCKECGIVEAVDTVKTRAQGSGVGAAGGAVVGGLLGRQVGDGRGRDLATIAGAVGGAVVGNQVEGNMKATSKYDVTVRMHDGQVRTFHTDSPVWRSGDQVKVVEGQLQSR